VKPLRGCACVSPHAGPTEVEASRIVTDDPDPKASGAFLFVPLGVEDMMFIREER
jgi:hypothetical protein